MSHIPLLDKFHPEFLWIALGYKSRAGLKSKSLRRSPRTDAEAELLYSGSRDSRQQRRNEAFHLAFTDISVKYPGESRRTRRAMARVRSKRNG